MISLRPETVVALRDRLRDRGAPPTQARPTIDPGDPAGAFLVAEYGPLCEVMYLMMSADGEVDQAERDVMRGALRELDDRIRTAHFGTMLKQAEERLAAEGLTDRLAAVARAMADDPVRGEVAFVLASAVAFADDRITMDENSLLNDLADALGISEARSEELMQSLVR